MKNEIEFHFKGQYALITGAAGEIGRAISKLFGQAKCHLILVDLPSNKKRLEEFATRLREEYDITVLIKVLNLREVREIKQLIDEITSEVGRVDILINNAGVNRFMPAVQVKEEEWHEIVDTNLTATFFMSQGISRLMIKEDGGAIINIASQHGVVGNDERAPYCASKAGIINLSKELAIEWARYNVRVNCVSPTFVITDKNEELLLKPINKRRLLGSIPLGRYCTPIDVAYCVMFLASPMSSMITGHNLLVDGGYTAR